jgi:hypothetical protein
MNTMKKLAVVMVIWIAVAACKKQALNENDNADIIYELQTSDTGFARVKYGKFYALSSGFTGVVMTNWTITGTGTFTRTESIRKGFVAELEAVHPTSANWSLKIKAADGTLLKTATPAYITDSGFYHANVYIAVQ